MPSLQALTDPPWRSAQVTLGPSRLKSEHPVVATATMDMHAVEKRCIGFMVACVNTPILDAVS
jgi:hypothetical protein